MTRRRDFLANVAAAVTAGAAGSHSPTSIDVTVWTTSTTMEYASSGDDPRTPVVNQLRSTLTVLANHTDAIDTVNVTAATDTISGVDDITDWVDVVAQRSDMAADSNLLIHHVPSVNGSAGRARRPICHLDDDLTCDGDTVENAAIVYEGTQLLEERNHVPGANMDPDLDGHFEDVNGDGRADVVDVQRLFDQIHDLPRPVLFDFNGDGQLDVTDVQKLYNEGGGDVDEDTARTYGKQHRADGVVATAVHEVLHNLGLTHDMGSARKTTIRGEEYVVISPMLGSYYFTSEGPSPGDTNRFGETIPDGDNHVLGYIPSDGVLANADRVIFDDWGSQ